MDTPSAGPVFRTSRDGYDRREVDACVERLRAERDDLRNRIADLESTLDATVDYLRSRRGRRDPSPPPFVPTPPPQPPEWTPPRVEPRWVAWRERLPKPAMSWAAAAIVAVAAVGVSAAAYWSTRTRAQAPRAAAAPARPTATVPLTAAVPMVPLPDMPRVSTDFVVALATRTACWIAIGIDGQRRIERMLQRDEEFSVHSSQEIVLRVGDAGAVTMKINGRPGKRLGPAGQPVTVRITRANYQQFIAPGGES